MTYHEDRLVYLFYLRKRIERLRETLHPTQRRPSQEAKVVQELRTDVEQVQESKKRRDNELDAIKKKLMSKKN